MSVVNTLEVKINGDTADLQKKLRQTTTDVAKWGAASVAAAAVATVALTSAGMKQVDALAKMSRAIDGSINSLQALKMAAGDTGLEGLEGSLTRMNRRLGAAEFGAGAAAVTVKTLGLDLKALSEMDVDQRLQSISRSMTDAGLSGEQMARHLQNLGFEQSQAVEFFTKGISSLEGYKAEIDALGLSLSSIDAAKVEAANDAMGIFGDGIDAVSQNLAVQFSPLITAISEQFQKSAMEAGGFGNAVADAYDMAISGAAFVIDAADGIKRVFQMTADWIIAAYSHVFERIATLSANVLRGLSKMPGVDFSDTISTLDSFAQTSGSIVDSALNNIASTLEEPLAGAKFKQFVADAEAASLAAAEAAVSAQQSVSGGGDMGGGESPATLKQREELEKRIEDIRKGMLSEQELMAEKLELELEALQEGFDAKLSQEEEYLMMREELIFNYEDAITQTQKEAADARLKLADAEAKAKQAIMRGMFSNLSSLMNTNSKQMFEIGKKAAIAQAAIDGAKAIQSAWAAGMAIGGPWAPLVAAGYAATAAITSANQINNIRSQQFGGGGGTPTPAAQGASNVAAPAGAAGGGGGGGTQEMRVSGIEPGALFTGEMVRGLAGELLDFQRNGGQVILT